MHKEIISVTQLTWLVPANKKDKMRWVAKCSVGITKLPNPLRTRYTVSDQPQLESGNQTIANCSLPKLLQSEW